MKRILFLAALLCSAASYGITRSSLTSYSSSLNGLKKAELKTAVYDLIKNPKVLSYGSGSDATWSGFYKTDRVASTNECINRYSSRKFYFTSSTSAPSGMNIEHSFPKSWWGGTTNSAYKDLFNLYPSDSQANSDKSNYPMATVTDVDKDKSGEEGYDKIGKSTILGEANQWCWEPGDQYKGDFSRAYMYMATCYQNLTWQGTQGLQQLENNTWPTLREWAYTLYLQWVKIDPVSTLEVDRNNAVYSIQSNRNLFVDYPYLAEYIWGDSVDVAFNPYTSITTASDDNRYNGGSIPTTPGISLSQTSATVAEGASLTLTATTQNATGATVTWTSSNTSVATVTGGTVTALAEGTTVITAKITVSGTTYSATCYVTVTRNETPPVVGGDYVKVTSAPADWSGTYLIVCEDASVALNGALSSLDVVSNTISVSPTNNQITSTPTTEAAEFTIASRTSGGYSIMTKGGTYIGHSGSNNALKTSSSDVFENGISVSDGNVTITCNGKNLRFNSSSGQTRFRYFGSDQTAIQLYKKTESAPAVPSITLDQTSVTKEVGNTFTLTATTQNADGATVVWASSNPQVATVNNGLVRCVASGATSISATITVNGVSVAATCNVTVVDNSSSGGDGTLDNPYSVAEVLALFASNSVPTSNVYVKGIISRITSLNTSVYTNARYYISDDGSETDEFYVYNGKYLNGADFTSDDQIQTGDEVVIYGKLTTYNTINEFAANNYIVSLNRPSDVLLGDVNRDGNVTIADVTALVNIILGKATEGDSNNYDFKAADVNEDEDITIADVTALVNLILHKE